jgi:CheY-like chemotaxis protein
MSTILVVDDDANSRLVLRERAGQEVVEAVHGAAALELISLNGLPDLITTDLTMPILGGEELIACLRSSPRTALIPIVVVSGNFNAARALHASGLVNAVIDKPIDAPALTECVQFVARGAAPLTT